MADLWHYSRNDLAKQVLNMFDTGLSYALIFFAPRRMGKTEFLCKDIMPLAEKEGWKVFYFSFLDVGSIATAEFTKALQDFAERKKVFAKTRKILKGVKKLSGEVGGLRAEVQLDELNQPFNMKEIISNLAKQGKTLLLLDEVQALAQSPVNSNFIAALRTVLDLHKDTVKVIFTGSSQDGLRRMFSQSKAPFFHFGQNLNFPEFDQGFTDHLAAIFETVTRRKVDREALWVIFQEMQRIPQLIRALVERLALNPTLSLTEAKEHLLADMFTDRNYIDTWKQCTSLERLLLKEISAGTKTFFSAEMRNQFARILGVNAVTISSIQSALRVLQRKELIGRYPDRGGYFIEDPNFKNWLLQNQ